MFPSSLRLIKPDPSVSQASKTTRNCNRETQSRNCTICDYQEHSQHFQNCSASLQTRVTQSDGKKNQSQLGAESEFFRVIEEIRIAKSFALISIGQIENILKRHLFYDQNCRYAVLETGHFYFVQYLLLFPGYK